MLKQPTFEKSVKQIDGIALENSRNASGSR